ncbi:eukaryotic translation initiation factor 1A, X-chromosomal-like isoform X3 [Salvelinus alpinus]|uniref:eukaryotic translation initiation factor 1A, X-chromosomal-like isoform X3 n=1 Tax=Salvelinus alpinus TaxID=8036 RepID=UPI0039FBC4C7
MCRRKHHTPGYRVSVHCARPATGVASALWDKDIPAGQTLPKPGRRWANCKGGKNRRRGKNENESEKRELVFKEDGQEYAQVIKMLGNGRLEAMCFDGVKRLCHIRGKLRKKVWINTSDIILVGLRDYQVWVSLSPL